MQAASKAALATFAALLLSLLIITHTGCKKPTDNPPTGNNTPTPCDTCLPPIATEGNSMFGCRVNGKVWLPKDSWMNPSLYLELYSSQYNNIIGLIASNHTVKDYPQSISLYTSPVTDTGRFNFNSSQLEYTWGRYNSIKEYFSEPIKKGYIHFTKVDRIKGSVAGTFEFDVYSRDLQDTIHITDGRFLIHK
jgi:hypothetical protein